MNSRINFDGGYSIPQENEYQTRGTWISMIPDKPIQGRSHPIRVERQGNQLERGNWQELVGFPTGYLQETLNYNDEVSQFQSSDPNSLMSLNGGLCNWNVSLDEKNRLINHIAGPYTQDCSSDGTLAGILKISNTTSMASENSAVNRSTHAGIRPLNPYLHSQVNIDATSIASGNSTLNSSIRIMNRPLNPNTHSQVNSNWRVSNSASLFPNNHKNRSDSSPWCNDLLHIPQCGFPIPYPPRIERNASSSIINSFQFAPVTPEQTKSENQLSAIQTSPIDGTSSYKKGRPGNKAIEHHGDELLQNIVDSSSTAISTPVKEKNNNQGGDQGIDLNKTPQQKTPRRRKHRPKVIIEGKPKRAPKPATRSPKSKENSSGKRKYVRKNGHKASETSKADVVGKTKDPAIQAAARSCRRALKFDLKKTTEENQGRLAGKTEEVQSGVNFNLNSDSQGTKLFRETDSNSGTKSAFHTGRQNGVIVGKWQAETTCKLTHSMNQMPFDYLSPPESRRAYPASLATTKVLQAESLNGVVNNINSGYADTSSHNNQKGSSSVHHQIHAEGIGQIVFQAKTTNDSFESRQLMIESAPQSMLKHLTDSNKARGHKRGYCHTVEETRPHTVNMMNFTLVCKERLQGHEENRSGRYLGEGLPGSHKKKKTENGLYTNTLSTLPSVTTAKEGSQQTKLNRGNEVDARQVTSQINQDILNSYVGNSSTPKNIINGSSKFASDWYSPSRAAGYNFPNQPNSSEVHLHTASMGEKRSTQVCDFISLTASKKGNLISHTPPKRAPTHVDGQGVETFSTDTPAKKQTVRHTVSKLLASGKDKVLPLQHEEVHGYQQSSTRRGPSEKKNLRIPIDDVICQLKALSINCRGNEIIGKEPKALVLYKGEGKIVPYEGFDHMKKHKPRPKVDLDPETDRIWKLLMGKEGSGSTEGTNKDKEKWWEEERSVFRGRADSFIARMHLVQGDRRFSKWKGSVVDSVIGVFLTQNVSDHLSSSAFMSLAARFPYKSTTNITTCYKERKNMLINEPEVRILDQDESIGLCGEVSGQPEYNQSSMRCLISRTKRKTVGEEHTWGVEGEIISPLDLFNSSIFQTNGGIQSCSRSYTEEDPATVCNLNEIHGSASRNLLQTEKTAMFQNKRIGKIAESRCNSNQWNGLMWSQEKPTVYPHALSWNYLMHQQSISHPGHEKENNQHSFNKNQHERARNFQFESTYETLDKIHNSHMHQIRKVSMLTQQTFDVEERISAVNKQQHLMNKETGPNSINQGYSSGKAYNEANTNTLKARSSKVEGEKKKTFDWDSLRKQVQSNVKRDRTKDTMDSLDYEALRCADVHEISNAIKERGMNNMLAERIKDFLNRLVSEHGSIDLEWLRDAPPDKTKDYLLSIRGLGLKSVECVRLLTLHHLAFPVDTNVGRIAVRLGWVPLQPLPESLQLHLLELYPILESIQKYLWPRLCKLDQRTLYELHYQMITFGKVFCTKNKPNCNACPMRGECRHFASAFASARLALPGPEENSIVNASIPIVAERNPAGIFTPMPLPAPEKSSIGEAISETSMCEPIIEVPATPEPECTEISESDIEDAFYDDPDEIPTINLNLGEFTLNLQNFMQENNLEIEDANISKALVALTPEAASIPTAKLKNVSRLRTEHEVYELPDTHPLLKGLERREPDDPSPYLLAIWTPGETENSTQPPERRCGSQDSNKLCNEKTCFSCNSIREANLQIVRGTLLIPCRTAMKGSFPLNGTYFQVNEVFADHDSSLNPIDVPRAWLWNLSRRTVYFGTSVSTIFKGLSTEGIQYCFWRGFVCVRGFDRKIGAPRPLMARLHFPASKLPKTRNERKGKEMAIS